MFERVKKYRGIQAETLSSIKYAVKQMIRQGYIPVGNPHSDGKNWTQFMIKYENEIKKLLN